MRNGKERRQQPNEQNYAEEAEPLTQTLAVDVRVVDQTLIALERDEHHCDRRAVNGHRLQKRDQNAEPLTERPVGQNETHQVERDVDRSHQQVADGQVGDERVGRGQRVAQVIQDFADENVAHQ